MTTSSNVTIELIEDSHLEEVAMLRKSFLDSKHFFCCIPLGVGSENELHKYYGKTPGLKAVAAVAVLNETVVGFCQLVLHGMPCDIHTVKPGECYVYMLAVDQEARGKGVGSALLRWADNVARARVCTYLSLEVIHGNKAIDLYERKGYVVKPTPLWKRILCAIPYCFIMGPVICTAGSPMYCSYGQAHSMEKQLDGTGTTNE